MGVAEKIVLWDSWLRGESPKATWRAFGKPSSLFIASWPPVLRRPVATTPESGQTRAKLDCPLSATSGDPDETRIRDWRIEYPSTKNPGTLPGLCCLNGVAIQQTLDAAHGNAALQGGKADMDQPLVHKSAPIIT
jgi:hypothetical protein